MEAIVSRETIARMADGSARHWCANPTEPKPANPFDSVVAPDHARAWQAAFERFLLLHSAPEAEGSA